MSRIIRKRRHAIGQGAGVQAHEDAGQERRHFDHAEHELGAGLLEDQPAHGGGLEPASHQADALPDVEPAKTGLPEGREGGRAHRMKCARGGGAIGHQVPSGLRVDLSDRVRRSGEAIARTPVAEGLHNISHHLSRRYSSFRDKMELARRRSDDAGLMPTSARADRPATASRPRRLFRSSETVLVSTLEPPMPRRLMWRGWSGSAVRGAREAGVRDQGRAKRAERSSERSSSCTALAIIGLIAGTSPGRSAALMPRCTAGERCSIESSGCRTIPRSEPEQVLAERLRNAASARQTLAKMTTPGSAMEHVPASRRNGRELGRYPVGERQSLDRALVGRLRAGRRTSVPAEARRPLDLGDRDVIERQLWRCFWCPTRPRSAIRRGCAGGVVVPESVQTTNSWGCRGPEPDLTAPVRVLVLGDSMMQGALVGDQDTPPARLEGYLARALDTPRLGSEHGPHRLFARAVRSNPPRSGRPIPAAVRRHQREPERLRRPERPGELVRGRVLARSDRGSLQVARLAFPVRARGG